MMKVVIVAQLVRHFPQGKGPMFDPSTCQCNLSLSLEWQILGWNRCPPKLLATGWGLIPQPVASSPMLIRRCLTSHLQLVMGQRPVTICVQKFISWNISCTSFHFSPKSIIILWALCQNNQNCCGFVRPPVSNDQQSLKKPTLCCSASSITGAVRSMVSSRLFTRWGGDGSTNKPTLSQESARLGDAKLWKWNVSKFRELPQISRSERILRASPYWLLL